MNSLICAERPKKHRQMLQAHFAYHEMERERLDPLIRDAWDIEKVSQSLPKDAPITLAFRNDLLRKWLKEDTQAKRDAVDKFRREDLARRKEEDRLQEEAENALLYPGEGTLPEEERQRLVLVRSRHRLVSLYDLADP